MTNRGGGAGYQTAYQGYSSNSTRRDGYKQVGVSDDDRPQMSTFDIMNRSEYGQEFERRTPSLEQPWALYACFGLLIFLLLFSAPHHHNANTFNLSKSQDTAATCELPARFQLDENNFTYLNSSDLCIHGLSLDTCACEDPVVPLKINSPSWKKAMQLNIELVNQSIASSTQLDVVMLGDSITEMWNNRQSGNFGSWKNNSIAFQKFFQKNNGSKVEGLALGISGDRTQNLLYRIQHGEMPKALDPKVWWLLIGTNNLGIEACNADAITAGNIRIVEEIRKHSPQTPIVINSILPRGNEELLHHNTAWRILQTVNSRLECYADSQENVLFFNATNLFVYNGMTAGIGPGFYVNATLMPDYLHHSGYGATVWGEAIQKEALELTGSKK